MARVRSLAYIIFSVAALTWIVVSFPQQFASLWRLVDPRFRAPGWLLQGLILPGDLLVELPGPEDEWHYNRGPSITLEQYRGVVCAYNTAACPEAAAMYTALVAPAPGVDAVDPAIEAAQAIVETGLGTTGVGTARNLHGVQCHVGDDRTGTVPMGGGNGCAAAYDNWSRGIAAWRVLLNREYFPVGKTTIDTVLPTYAPPTENNTAVYAEGMKSCVVQLRSGSERCNPGMPLAEARRLRTPVAAAGGIVNWRVLFSAGYAQLTIALQSLERWAPSRLPLAGVRLPIGRSTGGQVYPVATMNRDYGGFWLTGEVWCFQDADCRHLGHDLGADPGSTVMAPWDGVFVACGEYPGGATIGRYFLYRTAYAPIYDAEVYLGHLATTECPAPGSLVRAGQVIGTVLDLDSINNPGWRARGEVSAWSHVHMQVRLAGSGRLVDFMEVWCLDRRTGECAAPPGTIWGSTLGHE